MTINIFSARGSSLPVFAAAKTYRQLSGQEVKVTVCGEACVRGDCAPKDADHGFAREVLDGSFDLAIAGAEADMDDLELTGELAPGSRRSLGLRESVILVPKGNPAAIAGLADLARPGIRIAVSTIDCLRAVWEDVCGRAGCIVPVGRNVTHRVTGCMALIEAVLHRRVDAAFGWSTFAHMSSGIESITLPSDCRIFRSTCVARLAKCQDPGAAEAFMDFLVSEQGARLFAEHGWLTAPAYSSSCQVAGDTVPVAQPARVIP